MSRLHEVLHIKFRRRFKEIVEHNSPYDLESHFRGISFCNGLFLLSDSSHENHIIWNLFTNKHKKLRLLPNNGGFTLVGLWYDDASHDYKVLRVPLKHESHEALVYSLRSNFWRRIGDLPCNFTVTNMHYQGKFVDGFLYWICRLIFESNWNDMIITFNVATEKLEVLQLPENFSLKVGKWPELHVLEGKLWLSIIRGFPDGIDQTEVRIDLYVGEKHEAGLNWSKMGYLTSSATCYPIIRPLSYCEEEDRVLVYINGNNIMWYNLDKQEVSKSIEVPGCSNGKDDWINHSTICWESLVSITD